MSLINCPECGKEISDKVKACPYCGYPVEESNKTVDQKVYTTLTDKIETAKLPKDPKFILIGLGVIALIVVGLFAILKNSNFSSKSDDYSSAFDDGLISFSLDGINYGYLNDSGEVKIEPIFKEANPFYNGYAIVKSNGKYGVIDKNGKFVIEPTYEELKNGSYVDNIFIVSMSGRFG